MKQTNKNEIHQSTVISRQKNHVDRDRCIVHGRARSKKYRVNEIKYIYGVNKQINRVNHGVTDIDEYSDHCHGYRLYDY